MRNNRLPEPVIRVKQPALEKGNDSNLLIVFYVQIMPDDFVMCRLYARGYRLRPEFLSVRKSC
ncbi:hypothetical protein Asd1617_05685 [Shigella dysenteriae 1617]|uniref:Uncharacterized protein n=1 Tax=Shigella dysenteriae 1617 TaxID=754093 RepID=A0A0A7A2Q3_SHIDY|nr:hypothetical protein Asd1617_05685 [Shigella dysenteriae 1617]